MLRKMSDNFLLPTRAEFSAMKSDYFRPSQRIQPGSGALLASSSMGKGISSPPRAFISRKRKNFTSCTPSVMQANCKCVLPLSWTGSVCQVWRFTLPSSRNTAASWTRLWRHKRTLECFNISNRFWVVAKCNCFKQTHPTFND